MHSDAHTVEAYIEAAPTDQREKLARLRALAIELLPHFDESMRFRMPTYQWAERHFGFALQKHYLSIYIDSPNLLAQHLGQLPGATASRFCLRFRHRQPLPFDAIALLLREAYSSTHTMPPGAPNVP